MIVEGLKDFQLEELLEFLSKNDSFGWFWTKLIADLKREKAKQ
jgi:hypothetical protein